MPLTAEQAARAEANRLAALQRRREREEREAAQDGDAHGELGAAAAQRSGGINSGVLLGGICMRLSHISPEQRARTEANRMAALRRREERQQDGGGSRGGVEEGSSQGSEGVEGVGSQWGEEGRCRRSRGSAWRLVGRRRWRGGGRGRRMRDEGRGRGERRRGGGRRRGGVRWRG